MTKITVFGMGSFGTALANVLAKWTYCFNVGKMKIV